MQDMISRKKLYELVWSGSLAKVAKDYGLTDKSLARLCEQNGVPVPPKEYWSRIKAGKKVKKPPLLVFYPHDGERDSIWMKRLSGMAENETKKQEMSLDEELKALIQLEKSPKNKIKVAQKIRNPHPVIVQWQLEAEEGQYKFAEFGVIRCPNPDKFERRRRRVVDAFLKALEKRGFKVSAEKRDTNKRIWISNSWNNMAIQVHERIKTWRRPIPPEPRQYSWSPNRKWELMREHTDELVLHILTEDRHTIGTYREDEGRPMEEQLNTIMIRLIQEFWDKRRLQRLEHERRHQEELERQDLAKMEEERRIEQVKIQDLEQKVADWYKSKQIKEFISEARAKYLANEDWLDWATQYAASLLVHEKK